MILQRFDRVLNWAIGNKYKHYVLAATPPPERHVADVPQLQAFAQKHGYFAPKPMVGRVSKKNDTHIAFDLMRSFHTSSPRGVVPFATLELLAKVLAYRDLMPGQRFALPLELDGEIVLASYCVDHVFNLWQGMPAFGLKPEREGTSSFLLFRGTDFSPLSKRGLASLLSDLDAKGPGYRVFQRAREEIHRWLTSMHEQGHPARAIGFSLGGSLACYTYIYEHALIDKRAPSVAFNPPGLSKKVFLDAHALGPSSTQNLALYINRWDPLSKVGRLFGSAIELNAERDMAPLEAHTLLVCGEDAFTQSSIDVARENQSRTAYRGN